MAANTFFYKKGNYYMVGNTIVPIDDLIVKFNSNNECVEFSNISKTIRAHTQPIVEYKKEDGTASLAIRWEELF